MPTTTTGKDPRGGARGFERRVTAARAFVSLERWWLALWPAAAVVASFAAASLLGLWLGLPLALRVPLLLLFAAALGLALWRARGELVPAGRDAGLARLERDSGASHQPLRTLDDTLPEDLGDPLTRRLWGLHRERLLAGLARVRLDPPRSLLPARDPWALRAALLLVLVVALVHARGEIGPRLASAFTLPRAAAVAAVPPRLDLWVTPPAYTRRPPLGAEQTRGQAGLSVPAGSAALVQLHHQRPAGGNAGPPAAPRAAYGGGGGTDGEAGEDGTTTTAFTDLGGGSAEVRVELTRDGRLAVLDGEGTEVGGWQIHAVPDAAPTAAFAGPPRPTVRRALQVGFEAGDDYGVAEVALLLAPPDREAEVERMVLVKPASQPPSLASGSFTDLTAHPMAGLPVVLRLEAVDGLGQKGRSGPLEMVLPAREFRHPLARAIIDQRRNLARDPATAPDVAGRLAALGETEAARTLPTSVPLTLRVAAARLSYSQDPAGRRDVVDLLWELALFVEDGALSLAEKKLRELQDELQRALTEGAEDAELDRLMKEMQQALDEFLEEMARQAMERAEQGGQDESRPMPPDAQTVEKRDLQQMLDRARELMKSGAKDAAREMLAQLQEMLENLKAGTMQAGQPSQGEQALSDLQKMMQLQQQLLDRSFEMDRQQRSGEQGQEGQQGQQRQGQQGQQGQRGRQPGQQQGQRGQGQRGQPGQPGAGGGQPDPNGDPMGQAAADQEGLRRALGELMRRLGEAGMEIPRSLGQAELEMREARGSLEGSEPGPAAESQTEALASMQRAGQAMMEQLREQMAQQQGGEGPGQEPAAQPGRRGRDPLGRSTRNDGGFDTRGVEIPGEGSLGQAREVLEELYRRAGDRRRPPAELEYYRRLLERF